MSLLWRFLCSILQSSQIQESYSIFETYFKHFRVYSNDCYFLEPTQNRVTWFVLCIYRIRIRFTFPSWNRWNLHSKISASICSWRVWRLYQGWSLIRSQKIAKNGENWPPWSFGHDSQLRVSHCFVAATIQLTFLREKKRPRFGSKVYSDEEKSERNKVIVVWLQKFCTSLPNWITIYCKKRPKKCLCALRHPPPLRPRVCQKLTVHVKGDLANQ